MGQEDNDIIKCRCPRKAENHLPGNYWQFFISNNANKAVYLICCESSCVSQVQNGIHMSACTEGRVTLLVVKWMQLSSSCHAHLTKHTWWFSSQLTITYFMRELCMYRHTWLLWQCDFYCMPLFIWMNLNNFQIFCFFLLPLPAFQCTSLGSLANGKITIVTGEDTDFGTVVNYTCNAGYDLMGSQYSVCKTDGTWSHRTPSCHRK